MATMHGFARDRVLPVRVARSGMRLATATTRGTVRRLEPRTRARLFAAALLLAPALAVVLLLSLVVVVALLLAAVLLGLALAVVALAARARRR